MISPYLPSRKFAVFVLALLLAVGELFLFFGGGAMLGKTANAPKKEIVSEAVRGGNGQKDSDSDGLKDWEEVLWKTDPRNPDTDGDGTPDGEEVKLGRDPTIPAPGDKIAEVEYPSGAKSAAAAAAGGGGEGGSVNLTREIARNISSRIIGGEQKKPFDLSDPASLVKGAASEDINRFLAELDPKISEKELNISSDNSPEAVRRYSESVAKIIFPKNLPAISEEDAITNAVRYKSFGGVDAYAGYYAKAAADMKKTAVPAKFKSLHKRVVELLMANGKIDESMKEVAVDPLKTILAVQQYAKVKEEMAETLISLADLIKKYEK